MIKELLINEIKESQEYFKRSTQVLLEDDSQFSPTNESMTVAKQVAHTASTIEWLLQGAFDPNGFDMNFEAHQTALDKVKSLKEARSWMERAYASALDKLNSLSEADLSAPLPAGPVMGGAPRAAAFIGIIEHTAHHRGALTVYSRLRQKVPKMPYMEM